MRIGLRKVSDMDYPVRKSNRLKNYDYASPGYYFVTICAYKHKCIFSHITVGQGLAPAENKLTVFGKAAEKQLLDLEKRYNCIRIDKYVIMPNHIHALIIIESNAAGASPRPTLSDVVCSFKSLTTNCCKNIRKIEHIFQNSYYDHIIRDESDYFEIWEYINSNPEKWSEDRFCNTKGEKNK